jgi:hypothetical protein
MNSYFIQREGGKLYGTIKTGQQEYGAEFILNGSKSSIVNPKRTFSYITGEVCIKVIKHIPCPTV